MNVTAKLVRLHLIEQQIRGLTGRLNAAEKRLQQQGELLTQLDAKREAARGQLRQVEATLKNDETEAAAIEERIQKLRAQMNASTSNKEYTALLTEVNTLKADKGKVEERALGSMQKAETIRGELAKIDEERVERDKLRTLAQTERDEQAAAIRDRLEELQRQRAAAAEDVPEKPLRAFQQRIDAGHEDIMAPLEEHDRRNREYACGSCQVLLPLEKLNALISRGEMTMCTNCGALLYIEEQVREQVVSTGRR